jgi:putative restriction endonuclease
MAFGVFIHREGSPYGDEPGLKYRFSKRYLTRAEHCVGGWILYYEPVKVRRSRGYYATAKVKEVTPDPDQEGMYVAWLEPLTFMEFPNPVAQRDKDGLPYELGLLNESGALNGNRQSAVRAISYADYYRILDQGLAEDHPLLPRIGDAEPLPGGAFQFDEGQTPFVFEQERERIEVMTSRVVRDRVFRRVVLRAYDERCAVTGLKLINGGGRAEVAAAHIRPVEQNGPDIVTNGLALSGTAHWMFDRGLIGVEDDLSIIVSRHVNDRDGVDSLINRTGRLIGPLVSRDRPHTAFLQWHRENCFKH